MRRLADAGRRADGRAVGLAHTVAEMVGGAGRGRSAINRSLSQEGVSSPVGEIPLEWVHRGSRGLQEVWMNTIGVVLLAAATATSGIGKPHAWKSWMRPHAVTHGPPTSGPITAPMMAAMGGGADGAGGGGGFGSNRRFPNVRSQVFFVDPPGMRIGWQAGGGPNGDRLYLPAQLTVPARYNFNQGYIYRLKITDIPGRPGLNLYPTIEVAPSTPATDAFLTHNPIPAQFTEEDFDQVTAGNFVTKVIYLPDPKYQELAIAGVETLVSTRLEPGVDPILEADRRGTILMIIRLGAIDLEMPSAAPGTFVGSPTVGAPILAPGTVITPGGVPNTFDPGTMIPNMAPATVAPLGTAPAMQPVDITPAAPTPFTTPAEATPPAVPAATDEPMAPLTPEVAPAPVAPMEEVPAPAAPAEEVPAPPAPDLSGVGVPEVPRVPTPDVPLSPPNP